MPMGVFHNDFDIMIEPIEGETQKKLEGNCKQAEFVFEALDDVKDTWQTTTGVMKSVRGGINLASVVGSDPCFPDDLTLYCREFKKNICGNIGHPRYIAIFAGPPESLGANPQSALKSRLERWRETHNFRKLLDQVQPLLLVFESSTSKVSNLHEDAATSNGMFYISVEPDVDQKTLRLLLAHKIKEILQKAALTGTKFITTRT